MDEGIPPGSITLAAGHSGTTRSVSAFAAAIELWEDAALGIVHREQLLSRLEAFERRASDPARFFEGGNATKERLAEARQRAALEDALSRADEKTAGAIAEVGRWAACWAPLSFVRLSDTRRTGCPATGQEAARGCRELRGPAVRCQDANGHQRDALLATARATVKTWLLRRHPRTQRPEASELRGAARGVPRRTSSRPLHLMPTARPAHFAPMHHLARPPAARHPSLRLTHATASASAQIVNPPSAPEAQSPGAL